MRLFLLLTVLSAMLLSACGGGFRSAFERKERVYQPPRMGAESRFEDGLRREKHPQNLWSKKERKDMEKMGKYTTKETSAPATRITAMQADSLLTGKTRDTTQVAPPSILPADSTRKEPEKQP